MSTIEDRFRWMPASPTLSEKVIAARARLLDTARHNIFRPWPIDELKANAGLGGDSAAHIAALELVRDGTCWMDSRLRLCFYPSEWDE